MIDDAQCNVVHFPQKTTHQIDRLVARQREQLELLRALGLNLRCQLDLPLQELEAQLKILKLNSPVEAYNLVAKIDEALREIAAARILSNKLVSRPADNGP